MAKINNLFNLPPDVFDLMCEKCGAFNSNPEDPVAVFDVLCQEINLQLDQAREYPEEGGRFNRIAQCVLILENIREDVAVSKGAICRECFELLTANDDETASCNNPRCSLYMVSITPEYRKESE